jgi:hypothetical protein
MKLTAHMMHLHMVKAQLLAHSEGTSFILIVMIGLLSVTYVALKSKARRLRQLMQPLRAQILGMKLKQGLNTPLRLWLILWSI